MSIFVASSFAFGSSMEENARQISEECSENETYVTCRSSTCFDRTCDHVLNGDNRMCTRDCKAGCACIKGYIRNENGVCVDERLCFTE